MRPALRLRLRGSRPSEPRPLSAGFALQVADPHAEAVEPYRRTATAASLFPELHNNLVDILIYIKLSSGENALCIENAVTGHTGGSWAWAHLT